MFWLVEKPSCSTKQSLLDRVMLMPSAIRHAPTSALLNPPAGNPNQPSSETYNEFLKSSSGFLAARGPAAFFICLSSIICFALCDHASHISDVTPVMGTRMC